MVQRLNAARLARDATLAVATLLLLAGCITEPQTPTGTSVPPPRPATRPVAPVPAPPQPAPQTAPAPVPQQAQPSAPPQPSVTLALQDEAHRAAAAGDFAKATQILERAIRIEPDRAELWIELARVHLKEGDAAQAEQFARRALLYTHNRYDLEQQAYVVIADARAAKH